MVQRKQNSMNTIEGNKLIAEFMGINAKVYSDTPTITRWQFGNSMLHQEDLEYHSSWDWLMPVVEKIGDIVISGTLPYNSDQFVRIEIVVGGYVKISNLRDTPITTNVSIEGGLLNAIYNAVVQFIQWYS